MKAAPWLLLLAAVLALAWTGSEITGARAEAERERGRVVELTRQREIADADAAHARRIATAWADSATLERNRGARIRQDAENRAALARQAATDAEARLRTTLDSLGASTGALDSLVVAHAEEIAARDTVIAAQDREIRATRSYAETMARALDAADVRTLAVMAERDSYRRQAEAWAKVAQPGWLDRLKHEVGRAVVYGGAGLLIGTVGGW